MAGQHQLNESHTALHMHTGRIGGWSALLEGQIKCHRGSIVVQFTDSILQAKEQRLGEVRWLVRHGPTRTPDLARGCRPSHPPTNILALGFRAVFECILVASSSQARGGKGEDEERERRDSWKKNSPSQGSVTWP